MEYYFVMAVRGLISRVGTGGAVAPNPPTMKRWGGGLLPNNYCKHILLLQSQLIIVSSIIVNYHSGVIKCKLQ